MAEFSMNSAIFSIKTLQLTYSWYMKCQIVGIVEA